MTHFPNPGRSSLARDPTTRSKKAFAFAALACLLATTAFAAVSAPPVFTDHMVLQRDKPVAIWGTADPSEAVTVTFADQSLNTSADSNGNWSLALAPLATSFESRTLSIRGENTLTFDDVLVGEVWLLSGQSNMEKPLGEQRGQQPTDHYQEALSQAELPTLRLFTVPRHGKVKDQANHYQWRPCSAETVESMRFSAAGFHFGKALVEKLNAPIGLIHSSFGGSMIEAWTPRSAFEQNPNLAPLLDQPYFAWVEGVQATELYQSMILPVLPYTLRGFLWYQGEANLLDGDSTNYTEKLEVLIAAWRSAWHTPDAPFYFAQIAPCTYSEYIVAKSVSKDGLPLFWEAQLAAVAPSRNIEIIPTVDLVTNVRDIHPTNKKDVGQRFANLALAKTYGQQTPPTAVPQFNKITAKTKNAITVKLLNLPDSLTDETLNHDSLFTIAGPDGRYHPATAKRNGDRVTLSNPNVTRPQHVRYAWDERASPPLNANTLPLYPFRTDSAKLATLIPQFYKSTRVNLVPEPDLQDATAEDWTDWQTASNQPAKKTFNKIAATLSSPASNALLTLQLEGLAAGPHTLVTYHPAASNVAIERDGQNLGTPASGTFYHEFNTKIGEIVTLAFRSPLQTSDTPSPILKAFAIDTPDPRRQAHAPSPANQSTLAPSANSTDIQLKWNPPAPGLTYKIYLHKNEKTADAYKKVNHAGRSSATYLATTSDTSYTTAIDTNPAGQNYAWRVDTISQDGETTRGNVWTFSLTLPEN